MSENEMGYRGSKSDNLTISVKEQRVDGRWYEKNQSYQRCTLKGFERNYQLRIPSCGFAPGTTPLRSCSCCFATGPAALRRSKQQSIDGNSTFFSTLSNCKNYKRSMTVLNQVKSLEKSKDNKTILNTWFVTGFSDAPKKIPFFWVF
jgi:hypothetical protein